MMKSEKVEVKRAQCYTIAQICERLSMARRTFFELRKRNALPWLEEIRPRAGRIVRYRADLVDRYLAGEWRAARGTRGR